MVTGGSRASSNTSSAQNKPEKNDIPVKLVCVFLLLPSFSALANANGHTICLLFVPFGMG